MFLSGQTPIDAATGRLAEGGVDVQTRQCLANLRAVLRAGGLPLRTAAGPTAVPQLPEGESG